MSEPRWRVPRQNLVHHSGLGRLARPKGTAPSLTCAKPATRGAPPGFPTLATGHPTSGAGAAARTHPRDIGIGVEMARDHRVEARPEVLTNFVTRTRRGLLAGSSVTYPVDSGFPRCSVLSDRIGAVARADTDGEGSVARGVPEVVSRRGELRGIFIQVALAGWFCVSRLWRAPRGWAEKPTAFA